jgi:trk system potassium uptake protein TrkH
VGYLSYALIGWGLLCLPICHGPAPIAPLDNLFIAASAISTTGLITVNTPLAYSFWGELVILLGIQAGGIGYMTLGSFVVLAGARRLSRFREKITTTTFTLPDGFDPARFIRAVILFTLTIEAVGAALLIPAFWHAGVADRAAADDIGASFVGMTHVVWQAIFHSVSAFCTAGFSLFPDSLEAYRSNAWINLIISALSLLGAIGFIVISDVAASFAGLKPRITLTSRIILQFTFWIVVGGAAILFFAEPSIVALPAETRLLTAWFQSMTAMTTVGFNSHPISALAATPILLMLALMIVGASPSGTGGGLKSTSVSAVWATMRSVLTGRDTITFFGHTVPAARLHAAYAALGFYVLTLFVGGMLLLQTEAATPPGRDAPWPFEDLLFEAASALGTVGLSSGPTADLTSLGKLIVISLMLIGRIGPLTFGLALFGRATPDPAPSTPADLAV